MVGIGFERGSTMNPGRVAAVLCLVVLSCFVSTTISAPVGPCASEPCKNGGSCVADSIEGSLCVCPLGFRGVDCGDVWFSEEILKSLEDQISSLSSNVQSNQLFLRYQFNEINSLKKADESFGDLVADITGPKFFTYFSSLEQSGVKDMSYLQIGTREFVIVITASSPVHVQVYALVRSTFHLVQTLPIIDANPHSIEAFSFGEQHCVAIAGSRSEIYCWNHTSEVFEKLQDVLTRGAVHVRYVSTEFFNFLVFSCGGGANDAPSFVYTWASLVGEFLLFQYLPTVGAISSTAQSTAAGSFIAIEQLSDDLSTSSVLFKWNGTYFDDVQSFDSSTVYLFAAKGCIFLASLPAIYRYDSSSNKFIVHSSLSRHEGDSVIAYKYLHINTEHYLAVYARSATNDDDVAIYSGDVTIYRLDGLDFVAHQTLQAPSGTFALHGFGRSPGNSVLAMVSDEGGVTMYQWRTFNSSH